MGIAQNSRHFRGCSLSPLPDKYSTTSSPPKTSASSSCSLPSANKILFEELELLKGSHLSILSSINQPTRMSIVCSAYNVPALQVSEADPALGKPVISVCLGLPGRWEYQSKTWASPGQAASHSAQDSTPPGNLVLSSRIVSITTYSLFAE